MCIRFDIEHYYRFQSRKGIFENMNLFLKVREQRILLGWRKRAVDRREETSPVGSRLRFRQHFVKTIIWKHFSLISLVWIYFLFILWVFSFFRCRFSKIEGSYQPTTNIVENLEIFSSETLVQAWIQNIIIWRT